MNKYIVRTSLVWAVVVGVVAGALSWRNYHAKPHAAPEAEETLAVGSEGTGSTGSGGAYSAGARAGEAALGPVQLSPEQMQGLAVQTSTAEYKRLGDEIRATGTVAVDERLVAYVQVRFSGYVRKVFADATYEYVRKGQPLFTMYSPEVEATQREYVLARQNERALAQSAVEGVAQNAAALTKAAEQRLRQWDVGAPELARMMESGKPASEITVRSQVNGYVTERNAVPNLYVEPSTRLYSVADLSRVWVNAQVFQGDAGRVKPGEMATIRVLAYPGQVFRARVEQVLPQMDAATRTVQVRLATENAGLRLKPGMYVNVLMKSAGAEQLTIPATAVFETGTRQIVFVDAGNGRFVPRDVVLGSGSGSDVAVISGLAEHQRVATAANFLLDSESQLQSVVQGGGGAAPAASQGEAKGVAVQFSTLPEPPHKGMNVLRVKLTGPDGKPVEGASVHVTFYMAAMPAMGMAAMKTEADLQSKGAGMYEGQAALESGGTWQVTVKVEQNGRTLSVSQMHVNASGGM